MANMRLLFYVHGSLMFLVRCAHPKYWLLWVILVFFWCVAKLPRRWQVSMGRCLGGMCLRFIKKLQRIVHAQLKACFVGLNDQALDEAIAEVFREQGIAIVETFWVWFNDIDRCFNGHFELEGYEYLEQALNEGRGVIVLACHHGAVDVNGALLSRVDRQGRELVGTFRQTDSVINTLLTRWRTKFIDRLISATDQRAMVRALKKGDLVWYAPDIEVKNKASAFVDFMGLKASTTLAVSRLAKATGAVVIPFSHLRLDPGLEYKAVFHPPLKNVPSEDIEADARAVNAAIEAMIAPAPFRYWWVIKRFKHRPPGEPSIYS